jgi:hypothetical protein
VVNDCSDVQVAIQLLEELNIGYANVTRPYLPALQDIQMMESLHRMNIPPLDWIIVADTDEFFTYGYLTLKETITSLEAEGATFALGEMLDHLSPTGTLTELEVSSTSCHQQ